MSHKESIEIHDRIHGGIHVWLKSDPHRRPYRMHERIHVWIHIRIHPYQLWGCCMDDCMDCCKSSIWTPHIVWIPVRILWCSSYGSCVDLPWIPVRINDGSYVDHNMDRIYIRYANFIDPRMDPYTDLTWIPGWILYNMDQTIWIRLFELDDQDNMIRIRWHGSDDMN